MQALPSAFFHQVSSASRMLRAAGLDGEVDERGGAAKRRGPRAGFEIVGRVVPPNGMSRCVCASMPPGSSSNPVASTTLSAARRNAGADFFDRFAVDQHVGREVNRGVTTVPC